MKNLDFLKHPALFAGSLVVGILALALGVYYALPGVYHVSLGHSHPPLDSKFDYAAVFLAIAVVCGVAAWVSRQLMEKGTLL